MGTNKNGRACPVAFHHQGSGRINAPHGGTRPKSIDRSQASIKNARDWRASLALMVRMHYKYNECLGENKKKALQFFAGLCTAKKRYQVSSEL